MTPLQLKEILNEVRSALRKTNPDYDLVIDRLHLYYDMQLVTFGIDKDKNCINTIPDIHTTIYTTTTNIIPIGNSASSSH